MHIRSEKLMHNVLFTGALTRSSTPSAISEKSTDKTPKNSQEDASGDHLK